MDSLYLLSESSVLRQQAYSMFWFVFLSRNYYFSGAITTNVNRFRIQNFHSSVFLFFRFPFTDTDDPQYSGGREGTILITPYDFHPLKNVQTNI